LFDLPASIRRKRSESGVDLVIPLLIARRGKQRMPNVSDVPDSNCMFGCTAPVPPELAAERMCVFHFTQSIEKSCSEMRRETSRNGEVSAQRQAQLARSLQAYAAVLASVSMGPQRLTDELKKRILTTFLTLMVERENLCRHVSSGVSNVPTNGRLLRTA
jgi:hypothetical protein